MPSFLRSYDDDLTDLANDRPALVDAQTGHFTGITLTRWLGAGGMAAVLLGDLEPSLRSHELSPLCPPRVAIKFAKPSIERDLAKLNLSPDDLFRKEVTALGRVMERNPPTEFVLGIYGHGNARVEIAPSVERVLPWLALEFVDSGTEGATLTDRVRRAREGIDPTRALRLVRGILEGVRVLHEERVIHRDLKPDNVFVSGPLGDETPKIADCGIARVGGIGIGTVAAVTFEYSAPEQVLSIFNPTASNPLIGTWTDLHALAAVIWFLIAGEEWCTSGHDSSWQQGHRRSLRVGPRVHEGFRSATGLLEAIDTVLQRSASHRLPDEAWAAEGANAYANIARGRYGASMFSGPVRYSSVDQLTSALVPLLEEASKRWTTQAIRENALPMGFRKTQLVATESGASNEPWATIREAPPRTIAGTETSLADPNFPSAEPGSVVFQPDGKVLARFADRLLYFVGDKAHRVPVSPEVAPTIGVTRWLVRGPLGGFALVGARHVTLLRGGNFSAFAPPNDSDIVACIGDGRVFGLVTHDDGDEPQLWRTTDGHGWLEPISLPFTGDISAIAYGPAGYLFVGGSTSKRGAQARALWLGLEGQASLPTNGLKDCPPLSVATCGNARDAWAAGTACVVRLEPSGIVREHIDSAQPAVAMALDPLGIPWLVTTHAVLRRHERLEGPSWEPYYTRDPSQPPLIGIGFTTDGARLLDAKGGGVHVIPRDIEHWSSVDTSMLVG